MQTIELPQAELGERPFGEQHAQARVEPLEKRPRERHEERSPVFEELESRLADHPLHLARREEPVRALAVVEFKAIVEIRRPFNGARREAHHEIAAGDEDSPNLREEEKRIGHVLRSVSRERTVSKTECRRATR